MTRVEVLAPLRLETRFFPDDAGGWTLKLRVYPDDFSLGRPQPQPMESELSVLRDALNSTADVADQQVAAQVAYRAAASALGARRAWWLWRTATVPEPAPTGAQLAVAAGLQGDREYLTSKPIGLPDHLKVCLLFINGQRRWAATMTPDHAKIRMDLEVSAFDRATDDDPVWWLDYGRATEVGLATEFALTAAEVDTIDTLVVVGTGSTAAGDLLAVHGASGRLGVIDQGTPTNTISGAATIPFGDGPDTWLSLLDTTAANQQGSTALLRAFGVLQTDLTHWLPIPGGDELHTEAGQRAVEGLWPVLWGRALRDVIGSLGAEPTLVRWATAQLAVQGPLPAIRIGEQPYGVLPTTAFDRWRHDPADDPTNTGLEDAVLTWAKPWRKGAAAAAAASTPVPRVEPAPDVDPHPGAAPAIGASAGELLALYGRHAPSVYWRVRPVLDLSQLQALQIQNGLPVSFLTDYDRAGALAWHGMPFPTGAVAAAGTRRHLPGPPRDVRDDPAVLREMLWEEPESLYHNNRRQLGLLGHLVRESMIAARATIGRAALDAEAVPSLHPPIDPARRIPLDDAFATVVMHGTESGVQVVGATSPEGEFLARTFEDTRNALFRLIELFEEDRDRVLRAVKSTLDTASFRVDPWLTGVAARRVDRLANFGVPFLLGAYGWVDHPHPWRPGDPQALAPGPTAAGLLHAPSYAQAQVAAVLRDAALRTSDDRRWNINLTSTRVRDAIELSEQVRLGVHPFEALGLQVEAIAGDPDLVRLLRKTFPTTPDDPDGGGATVPNDPTRRVCDGLAVLEAARKEALPVGVPADFAERIAPLDDVLDTYADLLLVDGVHSLMTRSPEAGSAAMDAAAGLSAPPALWGIRTPREATTVPVSCWVVLPPGQGPGADPVAVADPAFAALVPSDALDDPGHSDVARAAALLGAAETPATPDRTEKDAVALAPLILAMTTNLTERWRTIADLAKAALAAVKDEANPITREALMKLDRQWRLSLHREQENWTHQDRVLQAAEILTERTQSIAGGAPGTAAGLQAAIRELVARPDLPILPVVDRNLLPAWLPAPDDGATGWLEVVAAVRPRVAQLEAHQLTAVDPWPASVEAPDGDPWSPQGPVRVAYGPGLASDDDTVAVAVLDSWVDSVPSSRHVTQAAFGFNAPKTRAPQAVLLAVPPDVDVPLSDDVDALVDVVVEVRELALARAARPTDRKGLPWATPSPLVQLETPVNFLTRWS